MALSDAAALTEVGIGAGRWTARIVQCLEGHDLKPSAIDTMGALHAGCQGAPPQPKLEACVAGMVTSHAAIQAAQQQGRPMVQASVIAMVEATDV